MNELIFPSETILGTYRGSIAHNMYVPNEDPNHIDDQDYIGVIVAPPSHYIGLTEWGSRGTKEKKEGSVDLVLYEITKMVRLLLQGNPNVLGTLWVKPKHVLTCTEEGSLLINNRYLFVGKHVYNSFAGYASAQLTKMEIRDPAELREYLTINAELKRRGIHPNHQGEVFHIITEEETLPAWSNEKLIQRFRSYQKKGENIGYMGEKRKQLVLQYGYDAKNAAHCIRLLRMCKEFLLSGEMHIFRTDDREELLDIKAGKWKLEDIKKLAEDLFAEVKDAKEKSKLPEEPKRKEVEELLMRIIYWKSFVKRKELMT